MKNENDNYTTDGLCEVFAGKIVVARSYANANTGMYEVRILQGMDRMETVRKILNDCPEFALKNNLHKNYCPSLFSK